MQSRKSRLLTLCSEIKERGTHDFVEFLLRCCKDSNYNVTLNLLGLVRALLTNEELVFSVRINSLIPLIVQRLSEPSGTIRGEGHAVLRAGPATR